MDRKDNNVEINIGGNAQNIQGAQIGNNNCQVINNVTNNHIANHVDENHTIPKIVKQEKTTLKHEIGIELIKAAIGAIFASPSLLERLNIINLKSDCVDVLIMLLLLLGGLLIASAIYSIVCFLVNYRQHRIFKVGPIIATQHNVQNHRYYRYAEDDVLYRIRSRSCPFCEVEPKGRMKIQPNVLLKRDMWTCNENPDHVLPFDPKEKYDYQ